MTTPNNLNTDPLVLNESNGTAHTTGNGSASGSTVQEHAVNAKNSLLNCEVRDAPDLGTRYPSGLAELQLTNKTSLIAPCPRT